MEIVRHITRFVPRYGYFTGPMGQEVRIDLIRGCNGDYFIRTPWAMLNAMDGEATNDRQMLATLPVSFATQDEALEEANRRAPHWFNKHNQTILGRLMDARRWRDDLVGDGQLADAIGIPVELLRKMAYGAVKATRKQAAAAMAYKGGRV